MKPITFDEMMAVVRSRVPRAYLDDVLSTAVGRVAVYAAVDMFVVADARDADRFASLFVAPHSSQSGPPASGAQYATVRLGFTRKRQGEPFTLPTGTKVQTADGHVFTTTAAVPFGALEVNVEKEVDAVAVSPGNIGHFPPDEITVFTKIANDLSGAGLAVDNVNVGGSLYSLRFETDTTAPSPFRQDVVGFPIEITSGANVGQAAQIARVTSTNVFGGPQATEGGFAWATPTTTPFVSWAQGNAAFEWVARDWDDVGFSVRNVSTAVPGRDGLLDDLALARGRGRLPGETDEQVRLRLLRRPLPQVSLSILEQVVIAIAPYGFGRHDVLVYELGQVPVGDVSQLAESRPPAGGFISDLHVSDMPTPHTPDAMAARAPDGTTLAVFVNPGFVGLYGTSPWVVVVRLLLPGGLGASSANAIRRAAWEAIEVARQRGSNDFLYNPLQWGYPT